MIITQTFHRGHEEECGEEFFAVIPDDQELHESIRAVLDMIQGQITYKKYFIITIDTDLRKADVTEAV